MASVAMLRLGSLIRLSMSMLQLVTAIGCVIATRFSVRTCSTDRAVIEGRLNHLMWIVSLKKSVHMQQHKHCCARTMSLHVKARSVLVVLRLGMQLWKQTWPAAGVRTAAKRNTGLLLLRNSWRTVTAGVSSLDRQMIWGQA